MDAQPDGRVGVMDEGGVEGRGLGFDRGPLLHEAGQLLDLLVFAAACPERRGNVRRGHPDEVLIAGTERLTGGRSPDAELPDHLAVGDQGDRLDPGGRRSGTLAGDDRAVSAGDGQAADIEHAGQASQGGLDASLNGLRGRAELAEGLEEAPPRNRPGPSAAEPLAKLLGHRLVKGHRDDQGHRREERQLDAGQGPAGGLDAEHEGDDHEAADGSQEGGPECPSGHGRTEEDAGREHGIGGKHDGKGHEGHADPGVELADDRQEAHAAADATRGHRGQRRPDLALSQAARRGEPERLEQPPSPDTQGDQANGDPDPAEDRARKGVLGEPGQGRQGRDDRRSREDEVRDVDAQHNPSAPGRRESLGRDRQREMRRAGDRYGGHELLDRVSDEGGVGGRREALDDDAAAPGGDGQGEEGEHP